MINNIAACYCVYDDHEFLQASVESIVKYVDVIYFFVSYSRYDGKSCDSDNEVTLEVIKHLCQKYNCQVIRKDWKDQLVQRNDAISIIQNGGYEYCLIIDADEIWDEGGIQGLIHYKNKHKNVEVFTTRFYTYFKKLRYRIYPIQGLKATSLIKSHVRLTRTRGTKGTNYILKDISPDHICWHHPSHVRSDEKMGMKMEIANHEYACKNGWFEQYWLNWNSKMNDFHPEKREEFHSVVEINKTDLPICLQEIYDNEEEYFNKPNFLKKLRLKELNEN